MKSITRNGIRLGLVAGLVVTVVGVNALTVSGEPSTQQQVVVGELVLTVPGGSGRTGTVAYFAADNNGDIDDIAEATQTISASGPCVTITNTGASLLQITSALSGGRPVLPVDGLGVLTGNQNCGTSGVIDGSEAMRLSLGADFGADVSVSTTDLTVFRPDNQGGNLKVVADGVAQPPVLPVLVNGLNTPPRVVAGFTDTLDVSSTSSRFNKGILLRGATFTLVTDVPNEAPVASFTSVPTVLDVQFTDTSTDADGTIASWAWDFGDETTSTDQNPTHSYAESGTYPVTLTVTDNRGRASTPVSQDVTVVNEAPVADFTFVPDVLDVVFTDASTDADGTIASWAWDFGDGNTSTDQNPTHTYPESGTYPVTLTVTDNLGRASTPVTQDVTVFNEPPVADFTFEVNVLDVAFTDASTDDDGTVQGWSWDFGDDSALSTDQNPTHTYAETGTYTVTLTVTDDRGLASTQVSQDVTVKFDQAVFCSKSVTDPGGPGEIALNATFRRGENGTKQDPDVPCEDVGVIIEIVGDDLDTPVVEDWVFWDNSILGVDGSPQAVNGTVTIEWAPIPPADANEPTQIDFDGPDGPDVFIDAPWCLSYSFIETTVNDVTRVTFTAQQPPYTGAAANADGTAPWCLVSSTQVLDADGNVDRVETFFGSGDPIAQTRR